MLNNLGFDWNWYLDVLQSFVVVVIDTSFEKLGRVGRCQFTHDRVFDLFIQRSSF